MMKIAILFTCYNRIEKTRQCINSIENSAAKAGAEIEWFITDGGSSDGTQQMLSEMAASVGKSVSSLHFTVAEGAFYSQGMRACMELLDACAHDTSDVKSVLEETKSQTSDVPDKFDYVMLVNDDVEFYEDFLEKMLTSIKSGAYIEATGTENRVKSTKVLAGATNTHEKQSYGGIRYRGKSIKYDMVGVDDEDLSCHTFNANCVLIPREIYDISPRMDKKFIHGLGDFDYGMCLKGSIYSTDFYVGRCDNNTKEGTWMDTSLSRAERIKRLNNVKGSPTKQWFYYLKKHFGWRKAVLYSMTPYVRIILGK